MTDFSTLWDHAGDSAEREAADRAMHHAVAQVTPVSEFLFQASDEHDLENRIALASDRFTKAAVQHGVDEEALVSRFRNEASLLLEARRATGSATRGTRSFEGSRKRPIDRLAALKRALEEGQNPLEWLPAEDGGEGQAEDPSISGNEAFLEGDYVGGSNQQSTASRKTASDEHYRHGYSHGHSDHMRRLRNERLFGMTYRSDHEANPYEYGSDMHSGYANGRRDAMDGKPAQHQSPYDDGTWSDDDSDWGHDDSDPSLRMANRRKAARSLQAGDVISARATFHGEPLRREAVVAQVAQDAIEPGWVRINTQDGRVLRTPKIASVVLDPKA